MHSQLQASIVAIGYVFTLAITLVSTRKPGHHMKGQDIMATTNNTANVAVTPTQTDYTKTQTVHVKEHHQGHKVDFDSNVDTDYSGEFDDRVKQLVNGAVRDAMAEREKRENKRANHRNLNRALTLVGALIIGLVLTFVFQHDGIPGLVTLPGWAKALSGYTFVITIAMDSTFTFYALWKHY